MLRQSCCCAPSCPSVRSFRQHLRQLFTLSHLVMRGCLCSCVHIWCVCGVVQPLPHTLITTTTIMSHCPRSRSCIGDCKNPLSSSRVDCHIEEDHEGGRVDFSVLWHMHVLWCRTNMTGVSRGPPVERSVWSDLGARVPADRRLRGRCVRLSSIGIATSPIESLARLRRSRRGCPGAGSGLRFVGGRRRAEMLRSRLLAVVAAASAAGAGKSAQRATSRGQLSVFSCGGRCGRKKRPLQQNF